MISKLNSCALAWCNSIISSRTLEHLFKHHFLTFANAQGCCKSAAKVQCDQILSGFALWNSIWDCKGATGTTCALKPGKTSRMEGRNHCRRRILFFKIKVRPRSGWSYPIWRPWGYSIWDVTSNLLTISQKKTILFRLQLSVSFHKTLQFDSKIDLILRKYKFVSKYKKEKKINENFK